MSGKNINRDGMAVLVDSYMTLAPFYKWWWRLFEVRAHNLALEIANLQSSHCVLEVAVGDGHLASRILKQLATGWFDGVDLTPRMLEVSRKLL